MWLPALRPSSLYPNWTPVYRCPSTASPGTCPPLRTGPWSWSRPQEVSDSRCLARSVISLSPCTWQRTMGFLLEISVLKEWSRKSRCKAMFLSQPRAGTSARPGGSFSMSATVRISQVHHEYTLYIYLYMDSSAGYFFGQFVFFSSYASFFTTTAPFWLNVLLDQQSKTRDMSFNIIYIKGNKLFI